MTTSVRIGQEVKGFKWILLEKSNFAMFSRKKTNLVCLLCRLNFDKQLQTNLRLLCFSFSLLKASTAKYDRDYYINFRLSKGLEFRKVFEYLFKQFGYN